MIYLTLEPLNPRHWYVFRDGLLKRIIRNRNARRYRPGPPGQYYYKCDITNGKAYEYKHGKWMYKLKAFIINREEAQCSK